MGCGWGNDLHGVDAGCWFNDALHGTNRLYDGMA